MAKKQIKQSEQKSSKQKTKISLQRIIIGILALAVIGFFIVNNFITKEPKVEYYTFTKEGELTFTDSLGTLKTKINLEIADTEYERQLGLMNRKEMKENEGMLFIFPDVDFRSFWMLNTYISLDIIFLNENRQIITIHKNTATLSQQSYRSTAPAKYVVEVLAGFTNRHNIQIGDKINWMGTSLGNLK
jgi:uncharacterized membrane protein (UPF0127 family)